MKSSPSESDAEKEQAERKESMSQLLTGTLRYDNKEIALNSVKESHRLWSLDTETAIAL